MPFQVKDRVHIQTNCSIHFTSKGALDGSITYGISFGMNLGLNHGSILFKGDQDFTSYSKTKNKLTFSTKNAYGTLLLKRGEITGYKLSLFQKSVLGPTSRWLTVECNQLKPVDHDCPWCGDDY